jgi:pyruvate formate lyase activating enzyme
LTEWLIKNKELLDAVVITGGEPTLHLSLPAFIKRIKILGLKVKLDTNGTNPIMLERLISKELVNYVAMDIKAPLFVDKYKSIVGNKFTVRMMKKVIRSVELLNKKQVDYEFRTTLDKSIRKQDIISILQMLKGDYYIQALRENQEIATHDSCLSYIKNLNTIKEDLKVHYR